MIRLLNYYSILMKPYQSKILFKYSETVKNIDILNVKRSFMEKAIIRNYFKVALYLFIFNKVNFRNFHHVEMF